MDVLAPRGPCDRELEDRRAFRCALRLARLLLWSSGNRMKTFLLTLALLALAVIAGTKAGSAVVAWCLRSGTHKRDLRDTDPGPEIGGGAHK